MNKWMKSLCLCLLCGAVVDAHAQTTPAPGAPPSATSPASAADAIPSERSIRVRVVVKAPLDDVWNAWTTSAGITTFFAPAAKVEARVDGPFEIYMNPLAEPGMKGADDMRFLAVQDRKMITFSWNAPPSLPEARKQRTYVSVRFAPQSAHETIVTLQHGGWGDGGEWDKAYAYFSNAWPRVLGNLQKRFDSGPLDWTDWLKGLQAPAKG